MKMNKHISILLKYQRHIYTFLFVLATMIFYPACLKAQGDLLLFPKRIVFEKGKRTEIINLANISNDTIKYTISFIQIRMNENGGFEIISVPDSNQFFAD